MMRKLHWFVLSAILGMNACTKTKKKVTSSETTAQVQETAKKQLSEAEIMGGFALPAGVSWETNDSDPEYAAKDSLQGGTFKDSIQSFPLTMRKVGPDSNGSFAGVLRAVQFGLVDIHPNTKKPIPQMASHWAFDKDGTTVYYKLNPDARWSDGNPVTADDYVFTLEFMRSKFIVAPWYNRYYTEEVKDIKKLSNYVIAVTGSKPYPKEDLLYYYGVSPTPKHFHKLDEKWVQDYNWKIEPSTGPYAITEIDKGKKVILSKVPQWWGKELRYYRGRFNVDKVVYTVIRDLNAQWEYFKKGEVDTFPITMPEYWHEKSASEDLVKRGFINRLWFYTDSPQSDQGFFLNTAIPIFKDTNVRLAFAHAMNIEKVIKEVLRSDYERLEFISRGYGEFTNNDLKAREFDPAKVVSLMEKSGWKRGKDGIWAKNGSRFSVTVTYGAPQHKDRLVVLQQEAQKCGIELKLEELDGSASFKKVLEKKHEVAWLGWGSGLRPAFWEFYHSDNANKPQTNNITNISDKKLDALVKQYEDTFDLKTKAKLSREIQSLIYESAIVVTGFQVPYFREAYWRYWKLPETPATRLSDSSFDPLGSSSGGMFWFDQTAFDDTAAAKSAKKSFEPTTTINKEFRTQK